MKTRQKNNYFLLALAIIYFVIAMVQIFAQGILATQLYLSIALISLITTAGESIKSSVEWAYNLKHQTNRYDTDTKDNAKRHIEILGEYSFFSEWKEYYQKVYNTMEKNISISYKKRCDKFLESFVSIIQFLEVFLILACVLIIPLLKIPDNLSTTKLIGFLSLLSISLAFWSIYVNESTAEVMERGKTRIRDQILISNSYLDIIEQITRPAKKTSTEKNEEGEKQDDHHRKTL